MATLQVGGASAGRPRTGREVGRPVTVGRLTAGLRSSRDYITLPNLPTATRVRDLDFIPAAYRPPRRFLRRKCPCPFHDSRAGPRPSQSLPLLPHRINRPSCPSSHLLVRHLPQHRHFCLRPPRPVVARL